MIVSRGRASYAEAEPRQKRRGQGRAEAFGTEPRQGRGEASFRLEQSRGEAAASRTTSLVYCIVYDVNSDQCVVTVEDDLDYDA